MRAGKLLWYPLSNEDDEFQDIVRDMIVMVRKPNMLLIYIYRESLPDIHYADKLTA